MRKLFSKEIIIGFTVLLSLALLFLGIDYLKGVNVFTPSNFYFVKYTNVTGLTVSAPVTINGFQVGLVRDISYDYSDNGHMLVELSLDKDLRLPKGTTAVLAKDLLGTGAIELKLAKNPDFYTSGEYLVGANDMGMMDDVNSKIMPALVQMLPKIDSIVTNLNAITANPALNASITRLDKITSNLEMTTGVLNTVMRTQVPATMGNIRTISNNVNTISADLMNLSGVLKTLPLDSTMNNINATTRNLEAVTRQLTQTESTLGLLLNDRQLYNHLDGTISNVDSLLIDLKKHPKRYVNFKLF